jgi:hypothetical protein
MTTAPTDASLTTRLLAGTEMPDGAAGRIVRSFLRVVAAETAACETALASSDPERIECLARALADSPNHRHEEARADG